MCFIYLKKKVLLQGWLQIYFLGQYERWKAKKIDKSLRFKHLQKSHKNEGSTIESCSVYRHFNEITSLFSIKKNVFKFLLCLMWKAP